MLAGAGGWSCLLADLFQMLVNADRYAGADVLEFGLDLFGRGEHGRGVEDGACPGQRCVDLVVRVVPGTPLFQEVLCLVPVCVAPGGEGLADSGLAVADADGVLAAHRVRELREPAMLFRGDENRCSHWPSSR